VGIPGIILLFKQIPPGRVVLVRTMGLINDVCDEMIYIMRVAYGISSVLFVGGPTGTPYLCSFSVTFLLALP